MWANIEKKYKYSIGILAGIVLALFTMLVLESTVAPSAEVRVASALQSCDQYTASDLLIGCWYELIRTQFSSGGTEDAFLTLKALYEYSDLFIETGCHRHVHRIGDSAYYESYLTHKDLDLMEFPPITKVCGYGFYHGFLEHLTQDNPDPDQVFDTCNYFDERLSPTLPDIRITCFHGSGHGFLLAKVDTLHKDAWGNPQEFIDEPLRKCEAMRATIDEIEECKEGVFNVLVEWMSDEEFNLTYNYDDPFKFCSAQTPENQKACYYEMAQKLDAVVGSDVLEAGKIVSTIVNENYARMALAVGIAGMVQSEIAVDGQYRLVKGCRELDNNLLDVCIESIVAGMMEHGLPQQEHEKAIVFCSSDSVFESERSMCYMSLVGKLRRFHLNDRITEICNENGAEFKNYCETNNIP